MKKFKAEVIICDIEGTTTSISFVKDILFPFSIQNVHNFLSENRDNAELNSVFIDLQRLPEYEGKYYETIDETSIPEITKFFITLVDNDKKLGPLKCLQGLIWKQGYDNSLIKGHVYPDVLSAFEKWFQNKLQIFIYSSGSVQAQKLLFENSVQGNLLSYIKGHFDTNIGNKQEPQSYKNISKKIDVSPGRIIFFTDIVKEAEAAASVGIMSILLDRPGNAVFTEDDRKIFTIIQSFDEIEINLIEK